MSFLLLYYLFLSTLRAYADFIPLLSGILQERLLARRVLHFSSQQLFWECREHRACERYPSGFPYKDGLKAVHDYSFSGIAPSTESRLVRPGSLSGRDYWAELIYMYTSMSLTNPNDKLVALSGIAKARAASFGDAYVAGMWRQDLVYQLLWYIPPEQSNGGLKPRPVYRAPSWSWASVEHQVIIRSRSEDDHILYHIEDVHLTHATQDTTGHILSGWLQVRACLKPTRLARHQLNDESTDPYGVHWHMIDDANERIYCNIMFDAPPLSRMSFVEDNAQNRLFYIPTMRWTTRTTNSCACGLLLRVVDEDWGIFERLGYISSGGYKSLSAMLDNLEEEVKKSLPCIRYKDGLHTIRII
jgi:hypothetical protein